MSRRAIVAMSEKLLWHMITTGKAFRFESEIPESAKLCGSYYKCETGTFSLVFEHESLSEATEGDYYPIMPLDLVEAQELIDESE